MRTKLRAAFLTVALLAASPVIAAPTVVIDFQEFSGQALNFSDYGVTFSALNGSLLSIQAAPTASFGIISRGTVNPVFYSDIKADIPALTDFVSIDIGDFGGDRDTVYIAAFNVNGIELDRDTGILGVESGFLTLQVNAPGIRFVIFGGDADNGGASVLTDNFTFQSDLEQRVAPIPEPKTWTILICGFGLAGATLRRARARMRALA
jgi:hypothetical protein